LLAAFGSQREAYLRGRFELNREDEIRDAARVYLERAIDLDPSYAPAYAGLADFYRKRAISDDAGSEEAWQLAARYAEQALSLDGESAETHAAIAQIKLMHDWDWAAAREHALRALQLNPSSPEAHSVYARYLRTAGKMGEAVSQREQALALDPFRPDLREQLGLERYFARDFQANVAFARQVLTEDPNDMNAHVDLCFNLRHLGLYEESAAECNPAQKLRVARVAANEIEVGINTYLQKSRFVNWHASQQSLHCFFLLPGQSVSIG
jgi:hypothetical protein